MDKVEAWLKKMDNTAYADQVKLLALVRIYREYCGPCLCDSQHQFTCALCEADEKAEEIVG